MADMTDAELEQKILDFLAEVPGKGVEVGTKITKAVGGNRRQVSKALTRLVDEGKLLNVGAAAGVMGYKLAPE